MKCSGAPVRSRTIDSDSDSHTSSPSALIQAFSICRAALAVSGFAASASSPCPMSPGHELPSSSSRVHARISHSRWLTRSQRPSRPTTAIPHGASANAVSNWLRASSRSRSMRARAASRRHWVVTSRETTSAPTTLPSSSWRGENWLWKTMPPWIESFSSSLVRPASAPR